MKYENPADDIPLLRDDIDRYDRRGTLDVDRLLRAVREEEARSPTGWLDRLSTGQRRLLATGVVSAVGAAVVWHMGLRTDLVEHGLRLSLAFAALLGVVFAAVRLSLRDLAAPPPGRWAYGLGLAGLAILLAAPWLGEWLPGRSLALGPFWTLRCFRFTLLIGGVTVAVLLVLQRRSLSAPWRLLSAGVAGALVSDFFLMLHCDLTDATHQWSGHTLPGLVVVALALIVGLLLRRR